MEVPYCVDHSSIGGSGRNLGQGGIEDGIDILSLERLGYGCCNECSSLKPLPVVGNRGSYPCITGCILAILGKEKAPGIDENLASNLFGQCLSVYFY
ncbi:hypothetical protein SDC9_129765 [bioreactor metagenome]|uniref:Uncharacterized protein n=1 Tax=bioreactor metagenome TaxID=1076179 RepID=A0A645D0U7_9ZZZZ